MLLVPYHGHRDHAGRTVDGVSFLHTLFDQNPAFPWRVIMPVSQFGAAAAEVNLGRLPSNITGALWLIRGEQLDDPRLAERIRRHLLTS